MPTREKNIWKENLTIEQINDAENKLKEYLAKVENNYTIKKENEK